MKIFDCNCSYGRAARPPHRFAAEVPQLIEELDWCGIDQALVYHTNQRFASPVNWNGILTEDLQGQPCLHPTWAILPPACGELPAPDEFVAAMRAAGVRALRAFPQEHHYRLDATTFGPLFKQMAQRCIPLFAKENLVPLRDLLHGCPDLIVVAVNQGPHSVERHLRPLLDAYPNLHVETSRYMVEGLIEEFVDRYGPERLLFGSGFPDNCSGAALLRLAQADIDPEARVAVAGGNLQRLLEGVRL